MPTLFVDFDGTQTKDRYWRSLPFDEYAKVQNLLFGNDLSVTKEWMYGRRTAEWVNQYVAEQTGISYNRLWEVFVSDCSTMGVVTQLLWDVQDLRSQFKTVLITVNMDSFTRFTVPALGLDQYFDIISNSADEGLYKADNGGELFLRYADDITNSILLDDSHDACNLFRSLGGTAHQVTSPAHTLELLLHIKNPR